MTVSFLQYNFKIEQLILGLYAEHCLFSILPSDLKLYFPLGRSKYLVSSLPQTENNFLLPVVSDFSLMASTFKQSMQKLLS